MKMLWLFLAGLCGGILAGMGMGGGTLTIPLLVLALGVGQLTAQFANLVAFLPAGAAALAVHAGNGLADWKSLVAVLPAAVAAYSRSATGDAASRNWSATRRSTVASRDSLRKTGCAWCATGCRTS